MFSLARIACEFTGFQISNTTADASISPAVDRIVASQSSQPVIFRATSRPDRIVIYRLGSLGDTVASLPCFHAIERAFPESERLLLTNIQASSKATSLESILKDGGFVHGSVEYPIGLRNPLALAKLARSLRRLNVDTLVYLAASRGISSARRDVAFFHLSGIPRIVGAPVTPDLQQNRLSPNGEVEREASRLARSLAELGPIDVADRRGWDLRLTEQERIRAEEAIGELASTSLVSVNMGGKVAEKDWGEERWRTLLSQFRREFPSYGLAFIGAPVDFAQAERVAEAWGDGKFVNLCGKLSPRESAAAIERGRLFIGHDSGPLHTADAVGTPSIGLFGSFNKPKMWHPMGPRTRIIHRMAGVERITPGEVLSAAHELLAMNRSPVARTRLPR